MARSVSQDSKDLKIPGSICLYVASYNVALFDN